MRPGLEGVGRAEEAALLGQDWLQTPGLVAAFTNSSDGSGPGDAGRRGIVWAGHGRLRVAGCWAGRLQPPPPPPPSPMHIGGGLGSKRPVPHRAHSLGR